MLEQDTDQLLTLAENGDSEATRLLFTRYNDRLRRMIKAFLDPRMAARLDASDVLQDALTCAAKRLPKFLQERPIGFYPWLRQLVRQELATVYRRHVEAQRRSIRKEVQIVLELTDSSVMQLADRLLSDDTSPSQQMSRKESREHVRLAIGQLTKIDRELLFMRCIEQLTVKQTAEALELSESAVKSRLTRALQKVTRMVGKNE